MERTLAAGLPPRLGLPRPLAARFVSVAGFLGLTALPCFLDLTALPCLTGVLVLAVFLCLVVRTGWRCVPRSVAALTGHLRVPPLHLRPAHRMVTEQSSQQHLLSLKLRTEQPQPVAEYYKVHRGAR
jgi:hypothetical protein